MLESTIGYKRLLQLFTPAWWVVKKVVMTKMVMMMKMMMVMKVVMVIRAVMMMMMVMSPPPTPALLPLRPGTGEELPALGEHICQESADQGGNPPVELGFGILLGHLDFESGIF